jgi:hypothetical protein
MTVYYIKYIVYQIYSNTHPDSHRSEKAECRIRQRKLNVEFDNLTSLVVRCSVVMVCMLRLK